MYLKNKKKKRERASERDTTDDVNVLGKAGCSSRVKDVGWLAALIDSSVKELDSVRLDSAPAYQRHVAD